MVKRYDAGLLNDYGGGNVEWWQDYIRAEVERCNDHYEADYATLAEENRRLREALELVSAFFQKWPGVELLASERQARDKEAYHTLRAIARKAMEG